MLKMARKNSYYWENGSSLKVAKTGRNAECIDHAKDSVLLKEYNCVRHAKSVSTNTLELLYEKNGSKKQLILEK